MEILKLQIQGQLQEEKLQDAKEEIDLLKNEIVLEKTLMFI
tara:strand:+ start:638 stop:760 length:123 start_codon:yes stop_codon:yes gene_type:complete